MNPLRFSVLHQRLLALSVGAALVAGCAVGPAYEQPDTVQPGAYKEAEGWLPAAPADTLARGPWWQLFGDPVLNRMADSIEVSNQNVARAIASYAQARALVREQRAALFPSVNLSGSGQRSGTATGISTVTGTAGGAGANQQFRLNIGASWEPDIWGRLRAGVSSASASVQASAADLAAARLSAQGELAINYFSLRQSDAQQALLGTTIEGYQRVLQITQNRFDAGIAANVDLLQAQTQLANAQIDAVGLVRQRAQLEHAIALLLGKAPADFALSEAPWTVVVPAIPLGLPSTLLQRRPDIAAAERRVAVANEQIGIARSAYYPSISLTGSSGFGASGVAALFNASNSAWSIGASAAQSLFNAGATGARVDAAIAAHDVTVAQYRQTVLGAFADVENQLAATRALMQQQGLRRVASEAADQVELRMLNRYRAGQVSYTDVVTVQATALAARRALVQVQADRQTTAVALILSLGGGWSVVSSPVAQ
ncbi:MAG: NodT family efflux transporter outer membrane factor (OMF) lipoprotein [Janthinobacterium sp.]|jgi:NodT family efflux transporter outer membrane factor (OMF) lipoprotein